jgi:uncharacterized protein DUF4864
MVAMARLAAAVVAALMVVAGAAQAQVPAPPPPQTLTSADHAAIHGVIQKQIDALKTDDYAAAYSVVSQSFKALYPSVDAFARLIRTRYAQLIKPKSLVFGTVTQTTQGPVQRVFLTAADGKPYVANYSMQKQPDETWLISGCTVSRDNNSSPI